MKKISVLAIFFLLQMSYVFAQDANALLQRVRDKLNLVNNYEADAVMKTDIYFLKVPQANVKVYFKKPDKLKIRNDKGISFVPKGAVSINLNNIIAGNKFTVINAGNTTIGNIPTTILKLLPEDENSNVILSTIYVDEKNSVIIKAKTTTKDNGTYDLEMNYGKYTEYGLPDKVVFIFNTKDYKMPKGVTFDYDDAEVKKNNDDNNKGGQAKIEIMYSSYKINKGVSDEIFK
jgi:outer membrane lipoprotein-sorting protein